MLGVVVRQRVSDSSARSGGPLAEVEETLMEGRDSGSDETGLPSLKSIGRFVVLRPLGRGGMGMVYLAYDPELDRRIAIKLLRPSGAGSIGSSAAEDERQRLRREAQALARLSHPNVVAVHDVGEHEGQIFVAMEFVDGSTLGELMETKGSGAHLLPIFLQAARGLAAAHAEGLVHRDFKPANVMVGRDGRARVMDFGLARESGTREPVPELYATGESMLSTELTQEGSIVGTPRYMAPEQWAGTPATQATDQFSFCVALWRAMYGTPPFAGESSASLAFNVSQGQLRTPPRGNGVPRYVHRALLRGLEVSQDRRFSSMQALIGELEGAPKRRRNLVLGGIGVAVAGLVAAVAAQREADPCPDPTHELEDVWGAAPRRQVSRALEDTAVGQATGLAHLVTTQIDAHAEAWTTQRRDVCRATRVRGEQSEELMDLRMACLDEAKDQLEALVGVLREAENDVALKALDAVAGLDSLSRCEDSARLRDAMPMPTDPETVKLIEIEQARLARAEAERLTGQYVRSADNAQQAIDALEGIDYPPALVRAYTVHGDALDKQGRVDDAVESYRVALALALEHDLPEMALAVLVSMSTLIGVEQGQEVAGDELLALAHSLALRAGDDDSMREYWVAAAQLWGDGVRVEESLEATDKALELSTEPRQRSVVYNRRATTLRRVARFDEALADQRKARELSVEAVGERHPDTARMALNEAGILFSMGQVAEAKTNLEFVVSVCEETGDRKSSLVADAYVNLGTIANAEGDNERAVELLTDALELYDAELGSQHPNVRRTLINLGVVEMQLGRDVAAREHLDRAVTMVGDIDESADPEVGALLTNYGDLLNGLGEHEAALEHHTQALAVMERGMGPNAVWLSFPLRGVASDLVWLERADEALPLAQRASKLQVEQALNERMMTQLVLAQALWHSGNAKQARAVVTTLDAELAKGDPALDVVKAGLEDWRTRVPNAP